MTIGFDTVRLSQIIEIWESFTGWYWFVTELHPDGVAFGLVRGFETEWGYFSLKELETLRKSGRVWRVAKRNWSVCPCVVDDTAGTETRRAKKNAEIKTLDDALQFFARHGMSLETDGKRYTALACPRGRFVFEGKMSEAKLLVVARQLRQRFGDQSEEELWGDSDEGDPTGGSEDEPRDDPDRSKEPPDG
jgi:hypothetical protein